MVDIIITALVSVSYLRTAAGLTLRHACIQLDMRLYIQDVWNTLAIFCVTASSAADASLELLVAHVYTQKSPEYTERLTSCWQHDGVALLLLLLHAALLSSVPTDKTGMHIR